MRSEPHSPQRAGEALFPAISIYETSFGVSMRLDRTGVAFMTPDGQSVPLLVDNEDEAKEVIQLLSIAIAHLQSRVRS